MSFDRFAFIRLALGELDPKKSLLLVSSLGNSTFGFHGSLDKTFSWVLAKTVRGLCSSDSALELLSLNPLGQGYGFSTSLKIRAALIMP